MSKSLVWSSCWITRLPQNVCFGEMSNFFWEMFMIRTELLSKTLPSSGLECQLNKGDTRLVELRWRIFLISAFVIVFRNMSNVAVVAGTLKQYTIKQRSFLLTGGCAGGRRVHGMLPTAFWILDMQTPVYRKKNHLIPFKSSFLKSNTKFILSLILKNSLQCPSFLFLTFWDIFHMS